MSSRSDIFVSYSHDSEAHRLRVCELVERLRQAGLVVRFDEDESNSPQVIWPRWMMDRIGEAAAVLLVCTETYYRRFRGHESKDVGHGVDWETNLIIEELYRKKGLSNRFIPIIFDESDEMFIPEPLRLKQFFLVEPGEFHRDLLEALRSCIALQKETPKVPDERVDMNGNRFERGSGFPFEIDLPALADLSSAPLLRISIHACGLHSYEVEVETRKEPGAPFVSDYLRVRGAETAQHLCDVVFRHPNLADAYKAIEEASTSRRIPVRLQLILGPSAYHLESENWEDVEWNGQPLSYSPMRAFSRQLDNSGAESGQRLINPKTQVHYAGVDLQHTPASVDVGQRWVQPLPIRSQIRSQIGDSWVQDGALSGEFRNLLLSAKVLLLSMPLARSGQNLGVVTPGRSGPKWTSGSDLGELLASLGQNQPSLVILQPYPDDPQGELAAMFAYQLSLVRTPAVIVPVGISDPELWDDIASALVADLRKHGTIDLAVARARLKAQKMGGGRIILYLRAKSARLWYEPGLYLVQESGKASDDIWDELGEVFGRDDSAETGRAGLVFVGGDFDPELSWSRRDIARRLARRGGFALSKRESEDLGTVAEFLQISMGSDISNRPHIPLFLEETKRYLLRQFELDFASRSSSLPEIVGELAKRRLEESSMFHKLARLKVRGFVTVYFHDILEQALDSLGREYESYSFKLPKKEESNGQRRKSPDSLPTIKKPLLYHSFGNFKEEQDLLLSRSDYLAFFEEFCFRRDPITVSVRSLMASSPIVFLGFRATGDNLRMLLSILRQVSGSYNRKNELHIAVQVDPEDDHTIDPEGARHFCAGLISGLGDNVAVFWGTPQDFFRELKARCPNAFIDKSDEGSP